MQAPNHRLSIFAHPPANATFAAYFLGAVLPLLGYSQNVHTLHHLGMWVLIVFTIVHVYMAIREDICSAETMMSTMVNGWRMSKQ